MHDAGARLVEACRVLLASAAEDQGGQARESAARLAGAVEEVQEVLQQVPTVTCWPPVACRPRATASRLDACAHTIGAKRTTLLHLPNAVLGRIGRLAGKHCRSVCGCLRDAYGPPALALWQPRSGFEVDYYVHHLFGNNSREGVFESVLAETLFHGSRPLSLNGLALVQTLGMQWPGWAVQVTRLELTDAFRLDVGKLQLVHQALPGLRQLGCAGSYYQYSFLLDWDQMPKFVAMTTLCMLCSVRDVLGTSSVASFKLLAAAPNLQRLHLDLQHLTLDEGHLHRALQPLAQLTHLELACGPRAADDDSDPYLPDTYCQEVQGALASLADRLQRLVSLSPVADLGPGVLALQALTCLTSLGWCTSWQEADFDEIWSPPQGAWLLLSSLRDLVVGPSRPNHRMNCGCASMLAAVFASLGAASTPAFQALTLPVLGVGGSSFSGGVGVAQGLESLQQLAAAVAGNCPNLTSLHLGVVFSFDHQSCPYATFTSPPNVVPCLLELCPLRQLQQLVLEISCYNVVALGCLAGLPCLCELWVTFLTPNVVNNIVEAAVGHRPGAALSQLTSLVHLGVNIDIVSCARCLLPGLLQAAASLPRLQVLDVMAALSLPSLEDPWLPFVACPPPHLREVRLGCCVTYAAQEWESLDEVLVAFLRRHLAGGVTLVRSETYAWGPPWGPRAFTLEGMSLRWQRYWWLQQLERRG